MTTNVSILSTAIVKLGEVAYIPFGLQSRLGKGLIHGVCGLVHGPSGLVCSVSQLLLLHESLKCVFIRISYN